MIYLDNAATTKVSEEVFAAIKPGRDSTQGGNHEREIVLPFGSIIPAHPDRL